MSIENKAETLLEAVRLKGEGIGYPAVKCTLAKWWISFMTDQALSLMPAALQNLRSWP